MNTMIEWLCDPQGLTPHGICLLWEPGLIWIHALSDIAIGLSYFAIPAVLSIIIRRRPDLIFRPAAVLFVAFILLCGTGHICDLLTIWIPAYRLEGVVKAITAVASISTAIYLFTLIPQALALPSPLQMRQVTAALMSKQEAEYRLTLLADETAAVRDKLARELARREIREEALRESEERLRLLLQSPLAEALYLMDPRGVIQTWNAGAERLKGYKANEAIGRNFSMLFLQDDIDTGAPAAALETARATGHFVREDVRVRKDGSQFLARIAIDAVYREDGTLRGFVAVTVDLTKERIDEAQRRVIVEAAPNGLMTVDELGIITLANSAAEAIFGYHSGGLVGVELPNLLPDGIGDLVRASQVTGETGKDIRAEQQVIGRKRDGTVITIEHKASPVRTPRGYITVLALTDITDRQYREAMRRDAERQERNEIQQVNIKLANLTKHLEESRDRAEQANRAKSLFLASMSHELRTPLTAILGYAQIIKMKADLRDNQSNRLESIIAASRHLLEMINNVLDMSEIETEHVTLHSTEVDLRALCAACLDLVRPCADIKGLVLNLEIGSTTTQTLVVDPTRIRQVITNLLGNAIKYTQEGSVQLSVRSDEDAEVIRIEIRDTGPGIPIERRPRLFNTFDRLDAPNMVEGSGLGLAISLHITKLMGGSLTYEDNEGGGSVFRIELPAGRRAVDIVAVDRAATDSTTECSLSVLVVDDLEANRDIAATFLESIGHRVTCVTGGAEAVEAVTANDFDVVLMDVRMPDVNGLEATRLIRSIPGRRSSTPIIGLTAYAFKEQIEECRLAGMDGHLSKPFEAKTLFATINKILSEGRHRPDHLINDIDTRIGLGGMVKSEEIAHGPSFDIAIFERACALFKSERARTHLQSLELMCDSLINDSRLGSGSSLSDQDLVESVHTIAGSAGSFGFSKVCSLGRHLEHAAICQSADLVTIAAAFYRELETVRHEIKSRLGLPP